MLSLKEQSDIVVKKSDFDNNIYEVVYSRENSEKYISNNKLIELLNNKKVLILNKSRKKIIHRNFITMAEAIG